MPLIKFVAHHWEVLKPALKTVAFGLLELLETLIQCIEEDVIQLIEQLKKGLLK